MEIVNVNYLGSNPEYQEYSNKDTSLITGNIISRTFGETNDYIEYFIYDLNNNLLTSNYNVNSYVIKNTDAVNPTGNILLLNPDKDIQDQGFDRGAVNITYNFFRKLFNSSELSRFWINQISTDRTEIRVSRQDLSNDELIQLFNEYDLNISNKTYYPDFYLNFGDNKIVIGVNVAYTLVNEESALLIKLYEPLPSELGTKDTFWIVDKLSEPATYNIDIQIPAEAVVTTENLRGPNYNVEVLNKVGQITDYQSLSTFYTGSSLTSYQQLKSLTEEKGIDINVDYTNFNNFIHFSSVYERIYNFAYKIQLIESYNSDLNSLNNIFLNTNTVSGSRSVLQNKINDIIEKFDGYEYYLYYDSGSTSWPKSTNTKPYQLYAYTSSQVQNWLGSENTVPTAVTQSILYSASLYDLNNKDWLLNTVPEYLKNDPNNQPYQIFLNMIGQHFDNIWLYIKDITNRYNAENSLDKGISKDEVADALKSLGIKLYTNTSTSNNIYDSVLGVGPQGQILPNTGSELITNYVTTSVNLPLDDISKENYKRIYHNLPYLLKTKGTKVGLQALINCFGIPDTILRINEFGGSDKIRTTSDQIQDDYMVSYYNTGSDNIFLPWGPVRYNYLKDGNSAKVPDTIEFSFRNIQGIPTTSSLYTQSLFVKSFNGTGTNRFDLGINLRYNPATAISGTLSQYNGELRLYLLSGSSTAPQTIDREYIKTPPITLPFFDPTQWWTIAAVRDSGSVQATYTLYAANALYNQEGGTNIGFQASSSFIVSGALSSSYNDNWNVSSTNRICVVLGGRNNNAVLSPNNTRYQGLLKEFRYWSEPLSASTIFEHAKNLNSYTGNEPTSSLFNLIFRLPLGDARDFPSGSQTIFNPYDNSLLRRYSIYESILSSSHPAVTGTFFVNNTYPVFSNIGSIISQSAASNVNISYGYFPISGSKTYISEPRYNLLSTPSTGLNQKVNNKINVLEQEYLDENVLSRDISVQLFDYNISRNSQDIEVGFSPSDLIDYDITNQIGYFNIDDYIGSTSDLYTDNYTDLDNLKKTYFQKYISSFKLWDFVRLIKYYDNSLFKMIKDFVPARANLSTGIIVKPHILERSKYKRNEPIASYTQYSQSIDMIRISGSNPQGVILNTDYTQYISSSVGILTKSITDESQLYTGEFGGTEFEPINSQFNQYEVSNMSSNTSSYYITYSLNPLLNNVSSSVKSNFLLDIDYSYNPNIPTNNGLITQSFNLYNSRSNDINYTGLNSPAVPFAEVEDYNYNLFSYISSRYSGSKVSSQLYNVYTPPTNQYPGDQSYGLNPAINHYTGKLGLFSSLTTSSFFNDRTHITLLYLVDINGDYVTLNKNNKNIFEVQNIFKENTLTIDLFDPKQYGNQIKSNGIKNIYSVGYEYSPIFYTSGTVGTMSFDVLNDTGRSDTYYYTPPAGLISTTPYNISTVSVNGQNWSSFYNLYRTGSAGDNFTTNEFRVGTITAGYVTNSYFQPSASGFYSFYNNINFFVSTAPSETVTARLRIFKSGSTGIQVQSDINNTFSGGTSYYQCSLFYFYSTPYTFTDVASDILTSTSDLRIGYAPPITITGGFIIDQVEIYFIKTGITETAYNVRGTGYFISDIPFLVSTGAEGEISLTSTIDGLYLDSTNKERLEFQLLLSSSQGSFSSTPYVSSATLYNSAVGSGGDVPILNGSRFYLGIDVADQNNKLILTGSIASFYSQDIDNPSAIFLPSNSNLYSKYGDVTDPFVLEGGDKILINTKTRNAFSEYDVIVPIKIDNTRVEITVQPDLPSNLLSGSADGNLQTIIFLKKKEDETSIYINYMKPDGKTSFGFSIPEDINPNVLENIDTINKEIQSKKLINDVSDPLNQLNGGDF
jgi:hypothetical protein